MSIPYDALQEAQQDTESTLDSEKMNLGDWIDVTLALIIAVLIGLLIIAHYPHHPLVVAKTTHKTQPVVVATQEAPQSLAPLPVRPSFDKAKFIAQFESKHSLTGVFISENDKVALINNQFFNLGDSIDGFKLVSIESDLVRLKNNQTTLELHIKV